MKRKSAFLKYLLALLLFGSNGVVASFIPLASSTIVLLRSFLGSLVLTGIFIISGRRLTAWTHKRDLVFILLSGVAMAADWLFLFEAYARIGVSLGMLINYSGPVFVMALSPLVFHERLTVRKLTALLAALTGVVLIGGGADSGSLNSWGLFCAVMSAFSYTAMVILNKLSENISGMEDSLLQLTATFVTVAVFVGLRQGLLTDPAVSADTLAGNTLYLAPSAVAVPSAVSQAADVLPKAMHAAASLAVNTKNPNVLPGAMHAVIQVAGNTKAVTSLAGNALKLASFLLPGLWLGLVNTGAGCYFYFSSIGSLPVQTVAVCGYLEPLSAVVMSALVLGETMRPLQYAGAVLIIGGAMLGENLFKK